MNGPNPGCQKEGLKLTLLIKSRRKNSNPLPKHMHTHKKRESLDNKNKDIRKNIFQFKL